jgi:hypothetical protein
MKDYSRPRRSYRQSPHVQRTRNWKSILLCVSTPPAQAIGIDERDHRPFHDCSANLGVKPGGDQAPSPTIFLVAALDHCIL